MMPTHTHTHMICVYLGYPTNGSHGQRRVLRKKPEEKREGERE